MLTDWVLLVRKGQIHLREYVPGYLFCRVVGLEWDGRQSQRLLTIKKEDSSFSDNIH